MDPKQLYDLTPEEFEKLVVDLLAASGYTDVRLTDGPGDMGVDIIAKSGGEFTAIQVKHKTHFKSDEIRLLVDRWLGTVSTPRSLVFVTSADVPSSVINITDRLPPGYRFRIIDRQDLLGLLATHRNVADRYFGLAKRRLSSQRRQFISGIIGVVASVLATLFFSFYSMFFPLQAPLDQRIQTVEKALTSIRDLEAYLGKIRKDMVETEKATQLVNERYAQAKDPRRR